MSSNIDNAKMAHELGLIKPREAWEIIMEERRKEWEKVEEVLGCGFCITKGDTYCVCQKGGYKKQFNK